MESQKVILFLILFITIALLSQCKPEEILLHGHITGTITDHETSLPIDSVMVKLLPLNNSTNTDSIGKYLFRNLIPGNYEIDAS